jgi:hypothetical protein
VAKRRSRKNLEGLLRAAEKVASGLNTEADVLDRVVATATRLSRADAIKLGQMAERMRGLAGVIADEMRAESWMTLRGVVAAAGSLAVITAAIISGTADGFSLNDRAHSAKLTAEIVVSANQTEALCSGYQRVFEAEVAEAVAWVRHPHNLADYRDPETLDVEHLRLGMIDAGRFDDLVIAAVVEQALLSKASIDEEREEDPRRGLRALVPSDRPIAEEPGLSTNTPR